MKLTKRVFARCLTHTQETRKDISKTKAKWSSVLIKSGRINSHNLPLPLSADMITLLLWEMNPWLNVNDCKKALAIIYSANRLTVRLIIRKQIQLRMTWNPFSAPTGKLFAFHRHGIPHRLRVEPGVFPHVFFYQPRRCVETSHLNHSFTWDLSYERGGRLLDESVKLQFKPD